MSTSEITKDLTQLHSLPTSSKKPIPSTLTTLSAAFQSAEERLRDGEDPGVVVEGLLKAAEGGKKGCEEGLKGWYASLGKIGKGIDKRFPNPLAPISHAYDTPPPSSSSSSQLFSSPPAATSIDTLIAHHLARGGEWEALAALESETGVSVPEERKLLWAELEGIESELDSGKVDLALQWASKHLPHLSSPPHPSRLPFTLHRTQYLLLLLPSPTPHAALQYARDHLFPFLPTHSASIYHLLGALLFTPARSRFPGSPYADLLGAEYEPRAIKPMFRAEWCRLNGIAREDVLGVAVEVGASGGLGRVEKGRKVVESRMGGVRGWDELPMELPLPPSRRYHSIFACPVAKEQATDANPPRMLGCGHVIAEVSLGKLGKHGRRAVKCPYCPVETAISTAKRLYF